MREELLSPDREPVEMELEVGLRPRRLDEFVGQAELKGHLRVMLAAARERGQAADHFLFAGPPGLGKTTLAHIVAGEMGAEMQVTSGPALERAGDLAAILTKLEPGDVLFIDEIHRLARAVEEVLYPAMEDFELDIVLGKGPAARSIRLEIPPFTLVGATTRSGLITTPLRERFGIHLRMNFYELEELCEIVSRGARLFETPLDKDGAEEIARRSRGTPRVAGRLLRRVRDFASVDGVARVDAAAAVAALQRLGVDALGLDAMDRRYLTCVAENYGGGPVGIETLSAALAEQRDVIEVVIEPYLMQEGLIQRTPRGRMLARQGWVYLGIEAPRMAIEQLDLLRIEQETGDE